MLIEGQLAVFYLKTCQTEATLAIGKFRERKKKERKRNKCKKRTKKPNVYSRRQPENWKRGLRVKLESFQQRIVLSNADYVTRPYTIETRLTFTSPNYCLIVVINSTPKTDRFSKAFVALHSCDLCYNLLLHLNANFKRIIASYVRISAPSCLPLDLPSDSYPNVWRVRLHRVSSSDLLCRDSETNLDTFN